MATLKINDVDIAEPAEMQVSIQDIDGETNRNAAGDMIRDRITTKRKIELKWNYLSQDKISTLLNAVTEEFFSVTFLDPKDGFITKTMYVGDRTAPVYHCINGSYFWSNLSMNFIEK